MVLGPTKFSLPVQIKNISSITSQLKGFFSLNMPESCLYFHVFEHTKTEPSLGKKTETFILVCTRLENQFFPISINIWEACLIVFYLNVAA